MPIFSVVDIDEKLFDAAYSLVRTAMPDVSPGQWAEFARTARNSGGLIGLTGPEGALFGFLSYRLVESLRRGRVFHVDHFVTFELSHSGPGRRALCQAVDHRAKLLGCEAVEVRLDGGGFSFRSAKTRCWQDLGHGFHGVVFAKQLETRVGRAEEMQVAT